MAGTDEKCVCIDTRVMDKCIAQKDSFIARYDVIVTSYDEIVKKLSAQWKGKGADAFLSDAKKIRTNITGIADMLSTMCSALEDCREVIRNSDSSLAEFNRNPNQN